MLHGTSTSQEAPVRRWQQPSAANNLASVAHDDATDKLLLGNLSVLSTVASNQHVTIQALIEASNRQFESLSFSGYFSYNPWDYAREAYEEYWERFAPLRANTVVLGMNPGHWGMVQTGIPFGNVPIVRDWMGICSQASRPARQHPRRPVLGWACPRSGVSAQRVWQLLQRLYPTPEKLFAHCFLLNYCPLAWMNESGRNVTPDHLPRVERERLFAICDEAVAWQLRELGAVRLIAAGRWAEARAHNLNQKYDLNVQVREVPHPSPANRKNNTGWGRELEQLLLEPHSGITSTREQRADRESAAK